MTTSKKKSGDFQTKRIKLSTQEKSLESCLLLSFNINVTQLCQTYTNHPLSLHPNDLLFMQGNVRKGHLSNYLVVVTKQYLYRKRCENVSPAFVQLRTKVFFCFCTFWTKFCEILTFGNNLKLKMIYCIFRKIITLNEVNILESPNEYYQKQVLKNCSKKTLCPALELRQQIYQNENVEKYIATKNNKLIQQNKKWSY